MLVLVLLLFRLTDSKIPYVCGCGCGDGGGGDGGGGVD